MHYLKGNNTIQHIEKRQEHSLEYCISLKQKDFFKNHDIYTLKDEDIHFLFNPRDRTIFTDKGLSSLRIYGRELNSRFPHVDDVYLINNKTMVEDERLINCNWNIVNDFNKEMEDSHKLELSITIQDRNKDEYQLSIFSNIDTKGTVQILTDYLLIEHNGERVGDMSVVYSDEHLFNEMKNSIESLHLQNSSYNAPFFDNKHDAIEYGKINNIIIKECNETKILEYSESLINKSFTEFSCVDYNKNLSRLGIGKQMYFYMAQYLNKKGVDLYSSNMLSSKASGLWRSLDKNFKGAITKGCIFKEEEHDDRYIFSVSPDDVFPSRILKSKRLKNTI